MNLKWTNKGRSLLIHLPEIVHAELQPEWDESVVNWLMEPALVYILDFANTQSVKPAALCFLLGFCQNVEPSGKQVVSVNLNPELARHLRSLGLERRLCFVASEAEALMPSKTPSQAEACPLLLDSFVEATKHVIEEHGATPCNSLTPIVLKHGEEAPTADIAIAGLISIHSPKFRGTISLSFPKKVFLKIYSNMIGEKHDAISDEIKGYAAELINNIYVVMQSQFNSQTEIELPTVVPTVVAGQDISLRTNAMTGAMVVPFQMAVGNFQIEIVLEPAV